MHLTDDWGLGMVRWHRLSTVALILLVVWGSVTICSPEGQGRALAQVEPLPVRFTKAGNGVITDRVTGLDWYVGPNPDNTWHQAQAWAENLIVAGGGWRLPTMPELKGLYQKGASPINMDPLFQAQGAWAWSREVNNAWSAWGFAFYNGLEGWHHLDYAYGRLALAVRAHR